VRSLDCGNLAEKRSLIGLPNLQKGERVVLFQRGLGWGQQNVLLSSLILWSPDIP
jgi:hypothetical protein